MAVSEHDPSLARELTLREYDPDGPRAKPSESNKQYVTIYLNKSMMKLLDEACEALGETRYTFVRRVVGQALRET